MIEKEERHPNIEEIIKVLKHLNSIWKPQSTISYILETYEKTKADQEQEKISS